MRKRVRLSVLLPLGGILAGIGWGVASADDIKRARGGGSFAAPMVAVDTSEQPPAADPVAQAHGYALAASLGATSPAKCSRVSRQFRHGCLDYVADRMAGPADEPTVPASGARRLSAR